jgi:hypothetical protein
MQSALAVEVKSPRCQGRPIWGSLASRFPQLPSGKVVQLCHFSGMLTIHPLSFAGKPYGAKGIRAACSDCTHNIDNKGGYARHCSRGPGAKTHTDAVYALSPPQLSGPSLSITRESLLLTEPRRCHPYSAFNTTIGSTREAR